MRHKWQAPDFAERGPRAALTALAESLDRGETDRARADLPTLSDWTSLRIAEAFGVREDTVRLWRCDFAKVGTEGLKASVAPGPPPVKSETALRVVTPLPEDPVANRPNWTIARMRAEISWPTGPTHAAELDGAIHTAVKDLNGPFARAPARGRWPATCRG